MRVEDYDNHGIDDDDDNGCVHPLPVKLKVCCVYTK
jgi:hypothetical protein